MTVLSSMLVTVASDLEMSMAAQTPSQLNRLAVVVGVPGSATNLLMVRLPKLAHPRRDYRSDYLTRVSVCDRHTIIFCRICAGRRSVV